MTREDESRDIRKDEDIIEDEEEVVDKKSVNDSWKNIKFIPNKKHFIILSILFSILELAGLLIFAYSLITEDFPTGLYDFGLFILAPSFGLILSYFVENKKEAVAISSINGGSSIFISLIIYIITEATLEFPDSLNVTFYFFGIPVLMLLVQIIVAYTMARVRRLYYRYGDSTEYRDGDEAMINELRESRRKRGIELEPKEDQEVRSEDYELSDSE
ncbi:MAG: hypothetical protein HZR80_17185 [Candidatus Heimdallarchaeota archaeon]